MLEIFKNPSFLNFQTEVVSPNANGARHEGQMVQPAGMRNQKVHTSSKGTATSQPKPTVTTGSVGQEPAATVSGQTDM